LIPGRAFYLMTIMARTGYFGWAAVLLLFAVGTTACGDARRGFSLNDRLRTEQFTQLEPMRSDILWVIDSSCSMEDEQQALADNFPHFIDFFEERGLSFRLAVTTTNYMDPNSPVGLDGDFVGDPPWLDEHTDDLEAAFIERALVGIDHGHGHEKGLAAAYSAISDPWPGNEYFVREEAHLAIVIVSDEPDHTERDLPDSHEFISWEPFSEWLNSLKGEDQLRMTDLSSITGVGEDGFDDPNGCDQVEDDIDTSGSWSGEGADRGDGYLEATLATGGTYVSICDEDWSETLSRIGLTAAGLLDSFSLFEVPVVDTIQVSVDGGRTSRWTYREVDNSVVFFSADDVPDPGSVVSIRYEVPLEDL